MITHIVLVKPKQTVSQQQIDEALQQIQDLQKKIPEILSLQIGANLNREVARNQEYTHGFVMQFANEDYLRLYAEHPLHQAAAQRLVAVSDAIIDFDLLT